MQVEHGYDRNLPEIFADFVLNLKCSPNDVLETPLVALNLIRKTDVHKHYLEAQKAHVAYQDGIARSIGNVSKTVSRAIGALSDTIAKMRF